MSKVSKLRTKAVEKALFNDSYQKYYNIITEAQNKDRVKGEEYFERHHITPKSLGGSNKKSNLVLLTPEEHYVCHSLLPDFCEGLSRYKMLNAWHFLNGIGDKENLLGPERYSYLKREYSKAAQKFYQSKEGKKWKLNRGRIGKLFYQTERGLELAVVHQIYLKDLYSGEDGQKRRKDLSEKGLKFWQTARGLKLAATHSLRSKTFFATNEGKEVAKLHKDKMLKFYQSPLGKKQRQKWSDERSGSNNANSKIILQLNSQTDKIEREWDCAITAAFHHKRLVNSIRSAARGKAKTCGGLKWIYLKDINKHPQILQQYLIWKKEITIKENNVKNKTIGE